MACLKIVFSLVVVALLSGCSAESMDDFNHAMLGNNYVSPTGYGSPSTPGGAPDPQELIDDAKDGWGMAFSEAKGDEIQLQQGMTSLQVLGLLHRADATSTINCGQSTGQPWTGIQWTYNFTAPNSTVPVAWINLVFSNDNGVLRLNNWNMYPE